ncbi:MAG: 30S ribosomal protein S15 [Candidatus Komeilibacteria bacterium]|jgi:small subunit ribosomal protein S15|nr:30S ribosomal protein S15 [Candidatus Komeilibacteria bacterium]
MLDKKKKQRIIEKFKTHKNDTGSSEVQIAILTEEVKELTKHLREHKKDVSSRRGLLAKVSLRHKLLRYLEREDEKRFLKLVKILKLKIARKERLDIEEPIALREAEAKKVAKAKEKEAKAEAKEAKK